MFIRADDDDEDKLALGALYTLVFFETQLGSISQTEGPVVGAPVSSQADATIARKWIQNCIEHHPHNYCSPSKPVRLPTRLLDVCPAGGSGEVRLVITNGSSGQYITLSHRWGGLKPITLTAQTLPILLQGIAATSLPKTFQDAVTVTRDLGYQYLWIDSLCILQDSRADWENAVVEMPDIYNFAEVNICGPAATDCNAGFLLPRFVPPEWMDIKIPWRTTEDGPEETIRLIYKGPLPNNGELPHSEPSSALATRGWILQERMLSKRMLYFGSRHMYWECNSTTSFESLHFPVPGDSPLRMNIAKLSFSWDKPRGDWLQTWYELVKEYSTMELTYQTDKFPAISSLAQRFSQVLNDTYVAGLWRADLLRGLTWYIMPDQPLHSVTDQDAKPYVAPSWSWASTDREI
ncbi:Heterokaryon incompatibility protein (HET) domain containing protein, partial [Rhypophila sp. PSN 637]